MPVKYIISGDRIVIMSHGLLTIPELEGLMEQVDRDPAFSQGMSVLVLNRDVRFDISTNEALHLSQLMRSLRHRFIKFAIVVEKNIHFGLARMLQAYYENRQVNFRVFKERKEAENWLNQREDF